MAETAQTTETPPLRSPSGSPPKRYVGRIAMTLGLVLTGVILIVTVGVRHPPPPPAPPPPPLVVVDQRPGPGATAPHAALAAPQDHPHASDQAALDAWAAHVSARTQVPARVLAAYGRAEMWMAHQKASCHLSWATLAGIGRVEGQQDRFDVASVGADGRLAKPVVGPALDGQNGVTAVPDTDDGKYDGDKKWDHAIGPMQFLPSTWHKYAQRADGDGGTPDPQDIDDAAFTAARFLCSGGDDLAMPNGWWRAMLFYNQAVTYGQDVFSGADAYATASLEP